MSKEKKYISLSNDIEDFKNGVDAKEKAKAGLKILGKSIFNLGKYTVTEGVPQLAKKLEEEKNKNKR